MIGQLINIIQKSGYKLIERKNEDSENRAWFCTVKHEDTGLRCNKLMDSDDSEYYAILGMCKDCFKKYNPHYFEVENYLRDSEDDNKNT